MFHFTNMTGTWHRWSKLTTNLKKLLYQTDKQKTKLTACKTQRQIWDKHAASISPFRIMLFSWRSDLVVYYLVHFLTFFRQDCDWKSELWRTKELITLRSAAVTLNFAISTVFIKPCSGPPLTTVIVLLLYFISQFQLNLDISSKVLTLLSTTTSYLPMFHTALSNTWKR